MASVYEHEDIVTFLKQVFEERKKTNYSYSLRSFARAIGMSASHLLRVMNRTKKISLNMAAKIAQQLHLSWSETNYLLLLAKLNSADSENEIAEITGKIQDLRSESNTTTVDQIGRAHV